ncbi:MAG: hypothetical protein WB729_23530 [Candidatus Sulfotelmatobacter sp.]
MRSRPAPTLFRISLFCIAMALIFVLTFSCPHLSSAQELSRRLILKDGTYQLITKYEVKGERVRYYSAERDDWEELPKSLVDWAATEKYEKDRAAGAAVPEAVQLDKEIDAEKEVDASKMPEIAPGLRLPEESGVFLLDSYKGEPQLVEVQQTAGDVNHDTKSNIFRGAINPIAGVRQTIELAGAHASIQSHVDVPSIYIKVDESTNSPQHPDDSSSSGRSAGQTPQQPQQPQQARVPFDRFRIIHAQLKNGKRILGDVKRAVNGKVSQDESFVKTTIDRVTGGWLKVTPTESLVKGEYALVEMSEEGMNLYVWDFGVNPIAPANPNPWKPQAPKPAEKSVPSPK